MSMEKGKPLNFWVQGFCFDSNPWIRLFCCFLSGNNFAGQPRRHHDSLTEVYATEVRESTQSTRPAQKRLSLHL